MIKVVGTNSSPELSSYKIEGSRKVLNHREAVAHLYAQGIEHEDAVNQIANAWAQEAKSEMGAEAREAEETKAAQGLMHLVKALPPVARRLSQEAVDLLQQYMGWTADSRGVYQWFYRLESPGRVWDTCIAPIPAMTDKSKGRYSTFQRSWYSLHAKHATKAWVVFDQELGEISELVDDHTLLQIAIKLLDEQHRPLITPRAQSLFLAWAREDFDPKKNPLDANSELIDRLPNLRQIFDPQLGQAWVTNLMKEDPERLQIKMPETITNSPEVDAFTFVDLTKLTDGPTPAWDRWLNVVHPVCREIFMAAVFAPMHEKCRHRKLVWMRSQGYDGKSTFFNALNRWSGGKLTCSFGGHNLSNDFGMESLIGARILLWGDAQHEHALSTNVVHNITGGDLVTINRKNEKAIQYRFNSMLFVASNSRPQLKTWARNETTRLLYIPFIEPDDSILKNYALVDEQGQVMRHSDGTPMYKGSRLEEELLAEMPHILFKCMAMYKKYCPSPFRDLVVPQEVYDLMLEENEHEQGTDFSYFANHNLAFDPSYEEEVKLVHDKVKMKLKLNNNQLGDFFRYLEKTHKIQKRKVGPKGRQVMKYLGLKLSNGSTSESTDKLF